MAEKQKKTGTLRCPFSLFGAPGLTGLSTGLSLSNGLRNKKLLCSI